MLSALFQKHRAPFAIAGCGLISWLMIKILILNSAGLMGEKQTEMARLAADIIARNEEIKKINAQLEQARLAAQEKHFGPSASGMEQAELIKFLVPDSGMSKNAFQAISVEGGTNENYSFTVNLAGSFAKTCEYLRWLERDRPAIVIDGATLSPWQTDTTQVYLQLVGAIHP